jgi:hypothetical protein
MLGVRVRHGAPGLRMRAQTIKVKDLIGNKHEFSLRDSVPALELNLEAQNI